MNRDKRVWVFNHFASTPSTNTGAGERHFYLAEEFKKHGWQTTVFSASFNHLFLNQPERTFPCQVEKFQNGLAFVWIWVSKYDPKSGVGRLINWLSFVLVLFLTPKRKFGKPDIIIVSSMSMWPILNALWYRIWHPSVRVIFEIRDIWPLTPVMIGGISLNNPIIRVMFGIEKLAYKWSDYIVSVLPKADLRVREVLKCGKFNYAWVPNASSLDLSNSSEDYTTQHNRRTIIYAGAIGPANSLDILIEIANELKDRNIFIEIIGDGPERSVLEDKTEKLGLMNVKFIGKVKKELVRSYLINADALFISWRNIDLYKYGVSANKYNDYMALGKPIISVGNISNDPVELSGCGIVIKEQSLQKASQKIDSFLSQSEEKLKSIGAKGLDYWKNHKTYPVIGEKYIEVFNKLFK